MTEAIDRLHRRGRIRNGALLALVAGGLALLCLRPVAASPPPLQEKPPAGGKEGEPKPGEKEDKEKEEHGGDLVFHVVSKTQKYSVLYSHERHLAEGIECEECHEKVFQKKLNGNKFKMADINRGQFCGVCHNAAPAAEVKHPAFAPKNHCSKCHTLRVREVDK